MLMLLAAVGLAVGAGTALVAQRLSVRATPPQVVVAMTPPPTGSYETFTSPTPIPANERFTTAKPAQLTPAPTQPPTPVPPTPRPPTPKPAPTAGPTTVQRTLVPTTASPAANAGVALEGPPTPYAASAQGQPSPSIVSLAEQFVREYLHALDRGDTATAYAYLGGKPGEPGIVAQEAPLAKNGNLRVLSLEATADGTASAIVHARLESQGLHYKATYYVEPFDRGPHDLVIEHVDLQQE